MSIRARGIGRTYRTGSRALQVLRDIDLEVRPGEFVAIVGPSGSGKTTLLGLLAGLDRPTTGTITIDGLDLGALTEDERARFRAERVGFVFQTFQLIPALTALENVLVPIELASARNGDAESRARALLGRVGLADRLDHYPAQLSGGEQQRVAIARAFANRPRILFADEPTGNLDAETGATIIALLAGMHATGATTLLLVTHDPALAARADRIITMRGGRLVDGDGTVPGPA
jgi:putative ABC transport system ATP-binding protein